MKIKYLSRREQTIKEEIANAATHAVGIAFALVALPFLIVLTIRHDTANGIWAVSAFAFGMLMVYFSSTIYHAVRNQKTKRSLRVWDHMSIFLMIGGSYTPVVYKFASTETSKLFLIILWILIAMGCVQKIFFTGKFEKLSLLMYLALGWMAVFIFGPLSANIPSHIFWMLLAGGLAYTLGVVFYLWRTLDYHHAIWHCFVLIGTVIHFFAVYESISLSSKF